MAGTPKRAAAVETTLLGKPWTVDVNADAADKFGDDFTPMDDMRASASYRLTAAANLLHRYFSETTGASTNVLEVQP
jgi:xanthine dehydrogenase small subunit